MSDQSHVPSDGESQFHIETLAIYSLCGKTCYHQISRNLEAASYMLRVIRSLWNLTDTSAAVLTRRLSKCRALRNFFFTPNLTVLRVPMIRWCDVLLSMEWRQWCWIIYRNGGIEIRFLPKFDPNVMHILIPMPIINIKPIHVSSSLSIVEVTAYWFRITQLCRILYGASTVMSMENNVIWFHADVLVNVTIRLKSKKRSDDLKTFLRGSITKWWIDMDDVHHWPFCDPTQEIVKP